MVRQLQHSLLWTDYTGDSQMVQMCSTSREFIVLPIND